MFAIVSPSSHLVPEKSCTGGPPLTLFFGTAEKTVLEGKTVLEEDFLSTIYYKNGTAEFLRKKPC